MKFTLINPNIQGEFNNSIKAKNVGEAAQKFWDGMSRYFTNNLEKFPYTIMDNNGDMSHFVAHEKTSGNNVEFVIKKFKGTVSNEKEGKLKEKYNESVQSGGKRHKKKKHNDSDDDSSSSSSSSDYHIHHHMGNIYPVVTWDYYPTVYSSIDVVSVPTWVSPLNPAMNVWLI